MKFGIVTFPGSNCDYDAFHAVTDILGEEATYLWHKDHDLQGSDVIILPGGFSYGDYLRAGAIARFSPIMQEVVSHAKSGGPVLAICNGFQIACEAGLLPGALLRNESLRFVSEPVTLRVENNDTLFTNRYEEGQLLTMPVAHGDVAEIAERYPLETTVPDFAMHFERPVVLVASGGGMVGILVKAAEVHQHHPLEATVARLARNRERPFVEPRRLFAPVSLLEDDRKVHQGHADRALVVGVGVKRERAVEHMLRRVERARLVE